MKSIVHLCTVLSLFFLFTARFIKSEFGNVTIEQIFFHIQVKPEFIPEETIKNAQIYFVEFVLAVLCYLLISLFVYKYDFCINVMRNIYNKLNCICIKIIQFRKYIFLIMSFLIIILVLNYIERFFHVIEYFTAETSLFIEEHYIENDFNKIKFNKKNNLILIFLESMENGFSQQETFEENLIPKLSSLRSEGTTFSHNIQTVGTNYTFAGFVARFNGIPFFSPINIYKDRNYSSVLKNSQNILSFLNLNGYSIYNILGTSKRFTNKHIYMNTNLKTIFFDYEYFISQGYNPNDSTISAHEFTAFNDTFIYNQAKIKLKEISKNSPFVFIVETIETHFPNGSQQSKFKKYGDIRDAFLRADALCADFISFLKQQEFWKNTTVVIIGDHQWPDVPGDFTNRIRQTGTREVYNVFLNSCVSAPSEVNVEGGYAPFDMAPTILESIGAELPTRKWGIGTSLYSNKKTLLSRFGLKKINNEFTKKSLFYTKLN